MAHEERCKNFNHGRTNVTIRFCTDCGEKLNASVNTPCNTEKHNSRRKDRNTFCCDCGLKLR